MTRVVLNLQIYRICSSFGPKIVDLCLDSKKSVAQEASIGGNNLSSDVRSCI
jgi:hypothetical protein